jgi:hypothetical protein
MSMSPSTSAQVPLTVAPATTAIVTSIFAKHRRLSVRQRRRWTEVFFNWEAKNSYGVYDEEGQHALQVKEEGSGLFNILKRLFLRTARPFVAVVYDNPIPKPLLRLDRPFPLFLCSPRRQRRRWDAAWKHRTPLQLAAAYLRREGRPGSRGGDALWSDSEAVDL